MLMQPAGLALAAAGLLPAADAVPALDLARLTPARAGKPGRVVFVPGSRPDDVAGFSQVGAEGPPGCLRVVAFNPGEDDEGLDVLASQVVEGVLGVIRRPARGEFPAVTELQGR